MLGSGDEGFLLCCTQWQRWDRRGKWCRGSFGHGQLIAMGHPPVVIVEALQVRDKVW
jgi:hypothetical protein